MIKDILLQVSRSYTPYVQQRELWGMGQTLGGELDSGFNSRKYNPVDNGTNWEIIETTNQNSAVAIKTDGTLWGWGQSPYSGDNTSINRSSPVQIGTHTWVSASAGGFITSAIRSDGTLWAWGGLASTAYVGDGTNIAKSSPVQIGTHTWKSVTSLQHGAIAIRSDDTIWAWGQNSGQFGNGETAGGFGIIDNVTGPWSTVSPNRSFTIAIKSDGQMYGWGLNTSGQLGLNDTTYRSSPVQIGVGVPWVSGSTGYVRTFAIDSTGTMWAWGDNTGGALGTDMGSNRSAPSFIRSNQKWKEVNQGVTGTPGVGGVIGISNNGTLWAWGNNTAGQLGLGDTTQRNFPVQVGTRTWNSANMGFSFTMAIRSDGTLWTWGDNFYGQLGQNNSGAVTNRSSPVQVGTETNWLKVNAGTVQSLAIKTDGTLWGWGQNGNGHLGLGDTITRSSPVQVGTRTWKEIRSYYDFSMGIQSDNTLWAWGYNGDGNLGLGDKTRRLSPVQVGTETYWKSLMDNTNYASSPFLFFSMAIKNDGTLWGWGLNTYGQLGLGNTTSYSSPVQVGTRTDWNFIAGGDYFSVGITTSGTIWSWGRNHLGQLGLGDNITRSSPVQIGTLSNWVSASLGDGIGVIINNTGDAYALGINSLGVDTTNVNRSNPIVVGPEVWKDVSTSTGYSHTIAVKSDGTLWGWGTGNYGELGQDPYNIYQVDSGTTWVSASNGGTGTISLKSDGTMWAWGQNSGQLGLGDIVTRSSPVQVGTRLWKVVHGSNGASFGIRDDDTLWSWGSNVSFELGLNLASSANRSSPVQIGTRTWSKISGRVQSIAAIRSDGTLWSWGINNNGGLGVNDTINRSSPVQVGIETNWSYVSPGNQFMIALKTDGTLWSWGLNSSGQLGTGDTTSISTPVQVGTRTWSKIESNNTTSYGIRSDGTLWGWGNNGSTYLLGLLSDTANRSSPTQIGTRTDWKDIFTGGSSNGAIYVLRNDGTLWQIGSSALIDGINYGNFNRYQSPVQLGTRTDWKLAYPRGLTGTNQGGMFINNSNEMYAGPAVDVSFHVYPSRLVSRASPVQIGTETNWASVNAKGGIASTALKTDGTLWGWGNNGYGLVIHDTSAFPNIGIPKQIGTDTWSNFTLSPFNSYAQGGVKTDGTLWMWGEGQFGQTGFNDVIRRSSPVQVGTRNDWNKLSIGQDYAMATRTDGTLWGWGRNNLSQLGLGNTTARSSPLQIGTDTDWYDIVAGTTHTAGIGTRWNNDLYTAGVGNTFNDTHTGINGWGRDRRSPIQISQTNPWTSINSGGLDSAMAIRTDGTLWGWGSNTGGQLGLGDTITRSSPVQVGTRLWKFVKPSQTFTFGIRNDDTLWSWGQNTSGRLGLGDTINRLSPVQVGTRLWTDVEPGGNSTVRAIRNDGTLWAWGVSTSLGLNETSINRSSPVQVGTETNWLSAHGNLSDGVATFVRKTNKSLYVTTDGFDRIVAGISFSKSSPVQVTSTATWRNIFVGRSATIAISNSGSLWFWGVRENGISGDSSSTPQFQESPVQIGTRTDWVSGSFSTNHAMAIRSDNTLWAWGIGTSGQLGLTDLITRSSPVQVGTRLWKQVSTGFNHTIAIRDDDTMWSWGLNTSGRLGLNDAVTRSSPVQIGTRLWTFISAGNSNSFAILSDGTLWGWGSNTVGEIGDNTVTQRNSPVQIGTETNWSKVSSATSYTMAVKTDGTLWAWGSNANGKLGLLRNRSLPNYVTTNQKFNSIAAGYQSVIARSMNGTLWSWGDSLGATSGNLGLGDTVARSSPVQIGTLSWSMFTNGGFHTSAIRNGQLWIWGDNSNAQLGLTQYGPQYISGSNIWTDVDGGGSNIILKKNDNTLWSIGSNDVGQLGLGDVVNRISPVQIGTRTWNDYSTGQSHTLAVASDGTLWGWGLNTYGQLGLAKSRSNPNYVDSTQTWTSVKAGYTFSTAIGTDGTMWTWGNNNSGQLGFNDTVTRLSPVRLGTETNWSKHDSTDTTTIAIKTDGTLWGWGAGSSGILGLNDTNSRSSPVQIGTLNNWSQIYVGTTAASIKTDGTLWTWGNNFSGGLGTNESSGLSRSSPIQVGTRTWTQIPDTSGNVAAHVIAIRSDGTLWGWGRNTTGELGQITFATNRSSPVQIGTGTNWAYVAVGDVNSMAIRSDGTLWSWGSNQFGQLGLNLATTANRSSPVQVGTRADWRSVSLGNFTAFANRTDGTMWAWGRNTNGELGLGDAINRSSPVQIGTGTNWISGSLSDGHSILLENTGYALTTGVGVGQFTPSGFDTNFMVNRSSPVQIGTRLWSNVTQGVAYSLAVRNDGTLWGWGFNSSGALADGTLITRSSPVQIGTLNNWSKVYTSVDANYAIKTDGTLWSWGNNVNGGLGLGDAVSRSSPVQVGTLTNWANFADAASSSVTTYHALAIKTDGTLWAWGRNVEGQLGLNNALNISSPVQVGTMTWLSTTLNDISSMAIRSDGTLWAWGRSTPNSQLGFNDTVTRSSPVQVGTLTTWTSASLGTNFSVLLQNNGDAYTTGLNITDYQQPTISRSSPVQLGTESNWIQTDNGYLYSLAVKTNGTLWSWGSNNSGALGDGTSITRSSPVQIGTLNNWSSVAAGYLSSHALKTDGTLWGWGSNADGMLGNVQTTNLSSPIQIGTRTWRSIADKGGFQQTHNMAIRSDGTLWAWGNNTNGQLGFLSTSNRSSPVQVGTRNDWVSATVGDNTSMAIRSDGTLWAWGLNSNAELGLGDVISRSSPVQVGTLSYWASASMGDANSALLLTDGTVLTTGIYAFGYDTRFTINRSNPTQIGIDTNWSDVKTSVNVTLSNSSIFAEKIDGTLWSWGDNAFGQLGDGTLIARSSPVQVGVDTTWVDISVGHLHAIGIKQY
jgi:alpha-tubulin suppressor-like RCC1 family protein